MKTTARNQARGRQPWHTARQTGPAVAREFPTPQDPTVCTNCHAVYSNKVWRWPEASKVSPMVRLDSAARALCPACLQVKAGVFYGLVEALGRFSEEEMEILRARILNVAKRAGFTQPERRVVSIHERRQGLEIHTTSQKLAHRIARELHKAFGGEAKYSWNSSDGSLRAVWSGGTPTGAREPKKRMKPIKRRRRAVFSRNKKSAGS